MKKYLEKISSNINSFLINLPQKDNGVYFDIVVKIPGEKGESIEMYHLLEHYIAGKIFNKFNNKFDFRASTGLDCIIFTLTTKNTKAISDIKIFSNFVFSLVFNDENVFDREKEAMTNELTGDLNSFKEKIFNFSFKERFLEKRMWGVLDEKTLKNIKNTKLSDIKGLFEKSFVKNNLILTVGAYKPSRKIKNELKQCFDEIKLDRYGNNYKDILFNYSGSKAKKLFVPNVSGVYLIADFPGMTLNDSIENRIALNILLKIFIGGSKDGLFKSLREKGIYGIHYKNIVRRNFGVASLFSHIPLEKINCFVEMFSSKITSIKKNGVSREEIEKNIKILKKDMRNEYKNNFSFYDFIFFYLLGLDNFSNISGIDFLGDYKKSLNRVNIELIKKVSKEIFNKSNLNLIIAGEKNKVDCSKVIKMLDF